MPRFHFHLYEGSEIIGDGEGVILFDAAAAHAHGLRIVRDLVAHELRESGTVQLNRLLKVTDADNEVIECIAFADIIRIEPKM